MRVGMAYVVLAVGMAGAQSYHTGPQVEMQATGQDAPRTPRQYALNIFAENKAYNDARDAKNAESGHWALVMPTLPRDYSFRHSFRFGGGEDYSFTVNLDGTVLYQNMTAEDALLLLVAERASESMDDVKRYDKRQRLEEEAAKKIPPTQLKVGRKRYKVQDVPTWSVGVLADTNCSISRIRTTNRDVTKQTSMLHEAMHVATGCSLDPKLHAAIYQISPGLLEIFQDNPDLVKFLTDTNKGVR